MTALRISRFIAVSFLACAPALAHAVGACASDAPAWLTLTITAGALAAGADRTTVVHVHADGCAEVHRPAYLRDAGDFRVVLDAKDTAALRARIDSAGLRHFDAPQVRAKLGSVQKERAQQHASGGSEYFTVSDADRYDFEWADAKSRGSVTWAGLPAYAEAYPEINALQDLNGVASALQAIARRTDAVRVPGATP
jgi:hypothetical protein